MKNSVAVFLLIFTFHSFLQAQKPPVKFGDVSMEDFKIGSVLDSSASAVVLVDYGEAYINLDIPQLVFERVTRIKILKKDGLNWANQSITLYDHGANSQEVTKLKAQSYHIEGGKVVATKMDKDAVFDERVNKAWKRKRFALPNVKVGCIIEVTYTIISDFFTMYPSWEFQAHIPTLWSEYRAKIPSFFTYEKYMQGYIPLEIADEKSVSKVDYYEQNYRWAAENVPAFREEPYMTSDTDYLSKINFSLSRINYSKGPSLDFMSTWEKICERFLEFDDFGKIVSGSGFLKKETNLLTDGLSNDSQKAEAIFAYIKKSIAYNGEEYLFVNKTNLKQVFDEKKGNVAEINLALVSMLQKAGLDAQPVLLSTRDHGFIRDQYPMWTQFNYVVCRLVVNNEVFLLDATEKHLPMYKLPKRCLNGKGLVVRKGVAEWVDLENQGDARTTVQADLEVTADHQLAGKIVLSKDGYAAQQLRNQLHVKGKEKYLESMGHDMPWEVTASTFENIEDLDNPINEEYELTISDHVSEAGNMLYIDPVIDESQADNPFKLEERKYPVDFGSPWEKVTVFKLKIPANYMIEELPEQRAFMLPNKAGRYTYSTIQNEQEIIITSNLKIYKSLFLQEEYPFLREFFKQVVAKQSEQVVLRKR